MSRAKKKENYLRVAYSLLFVTPEVLEKYIDRHYHGGITRAVRDFKETLIEKLPEDQWDQIEELIDLSQHNLHQSYDQIMNNTVLDKSVLDILISKCVMTREDREEVSKQTRQSDRNRMILDILMGRPYDTYHVFMEALRQSDENDVDIIDQLHQPDNTGESPITKSTTVIGEYIVKLQKNYHKLVREIGSTDSILDQLFEGSVLSIDDKEEINSCSCTSEKVRCLLGKIHNEHGYTKLLQVLREDTVYISLADEVEATQFTEIEIQSIKQACRRQSYGSSLDVDTMITLMSVIFGIEIPTAVQPTENTSIGADLCRLKSYVRYIIKKDDIDDDMMTQVLPLIAAILIRLNGPEIEAHLKAYSEKKNKEKLKKTLKRLKDKEKLQEVIPSNIKGQIQRRIAEWEKNNKKFVTTAASKHVLESVRTNSCVTVTGSSGSGKTAIVRHVALTLQQEGYTIVPIDVPADIRNYYRPGIQTVFIIDDMCGNFTVDQQIIESWKPMFNTVKSITEDKSCKIVISCRLQIYNDPSFDILKPFKMFECNIISRNICLSPTERKAIAEAFLGTHAVKINEVLHLYDFFPLLCYLYDENKHHDMKEFFRNPFEVFQQELDNLYNHGDEGKYKICALALCVMFNNKLKEEYLTGNDPHVKKVIKETCEALKLNRGTSKLKLKESLDILDGTFICRQKGLYRSRHDKVFDFLTFYFGGNILECIINNSDSYVIHERFEWITGEKKRETDFSVKLPDDCLELYLDRLISDWSKANVCCVFKNNNLKCPAFRARFLGRVSKLEKSEQEKLVNIYDNVTTVDYALGSTALLCLCYRGYIDLIQWLLDSGADPNATRKDGVSPLFFASQEGHLEVVCKLLECNNVDPNLCNEEGASPLFFASQEGHLDVVCKLLECNNVDPNLCNRKGVSPLWMACQEGHLEVVCKLLENNNVDPNLCNEEGVSPLFFASQEGHLDVVCKLLECNNVDPNLCDRKGVSPLWMACQEGHLEVVCKLLENNNVDPNLCNEEGVSPIFFASQEGHLDVVCKLLECNNVDPNLCNRKGVSPLWMACQEGHLEVVCKLLENNNVDPNLCNEEGASPLFFASQEGHLDVVCKLLECNNVDPNLCNRKGVSPLWMACQEGHLEVVCKLLENNNVDPNLCNEEGVSPLFFASQEGHLDVVCKLLECNNVDPNLCNRKGVSPLWMACQEGHLEVVCKLLENNNVDPNLCNEEGVSPLFFASQEGHLDVVCKLLECNNVDLNLCDRKGVSPLWMACQEGHLEVVCKLLENNNVDPNLCNEEGVSPLFFASQEGHLDVVCKLLECNNVDPNLCNRKGVSPLWMACQEGHLEVVCKLLENNNVDPNLCNEEGVSPLFFASQEGHLDVVCKLLECNNVDPNLCNRKGVSPLWMACQEGHLEVVCKLLENNNVDPNLCNEEGVSPLFFASQEGHLDVVCKLLECNNVDPNLCNRKGVSPLWMACKEGHLEVVCKLLENNNVDPNLCNEEGVSPLFFASQEGHLDVVCKLLECNNVDPNLCDRKGVSPLWMACQGGQMEVVCKLLENNNVDPNLCNEEGVSPLFFASQKGHLEVVCKLLECNNVDPNLCNRKGVSPLLMACQEGRLEVVCKLLDCNSVDPNLCDENGVSPLWIARKKGHLEIVRKLLECNNVDPNLCNKYGVSPRLTAC